MPRSLRSLLQQVTRNRQRQQDLLDLAVVLTHAPRLSLDQVSQFLLQKAVGRGIIATKQAFHNPEVKQRAGAQYASIQQTAREVYVPFEDAWQHLLALVATLAIPDE